LRTESLERTVEIGFDGYAIGGLSVGEEKDVMYGVLEHIAPKMPGDAPRYLMGVGTPEDAQQLTEVGNYLYERLRSAPRFRFAIVSVEVSDSFTAEDLSWLAQRTFMDGLVLSQTVWDQLGRPDHFVPFATGYVWRPYEGERYRDASEYL